MVAMIKQGANYNHQRFLLIISRPVFVAILAALLAACGRFGNEGSVPQIIYLSWDEHDNTQILKTQSSGDSQRVSEGGHEILEFAAAPSRETLAFVAQPSEGHSQIWRLDLASGDSRPLLDCPQESSCSNLHWASDGRRLLYELRANDGDEPVSAWWLDAESGAAVPLLNGSAQPSSGARLSPDGSWLAYVEPMTRSVRVVNLEDGREHLFPSETAVPPVWSPGSRQLLFSNINIVTLHGDQGADHTAHTHEFVQSVHIFAADVETGEAKQLSPDQGVDDGSPAWSPDGQWIAFGRRPPLTAAGRQLWLMRSDGSDARALTDDLNFGYGPPSWSADSRYLLFQRTDLRQDKPEPVIWALEIETGKLVRLAERGMAPSWLERS